MRHNPKLVKKGKVAYAGDKPVRELSCEVLEENMLRVGPTGRQLEFIAGIHRNSRILYFLLDPADMELFIDTVKGVNKRYNIPLFPKHRPAYGPGTIELFWSNPLTKKLAGAVQFFVDGKKLVITHMAVKPAWQRQGLNSLMINCIADSLAGKFDEIYYDEPTEQGAKFMVSRGHKKAIGSVVQGFDRKYGIERAEWEPTYEDIDVEDAE